MQCPDELQRCVEAAGLHVVWAHLVGGPRHLDNESARYPITRTALDSVTFIALRAT